MNFVKFVRNYTELVSKATAKTEIVKGYNRHIVCTVSIYICSKLSSAKINNEYLDETSVSDSTTKVLQDPNDID